MKAPLFLAGALAALALSACTAPQGPAEVTRFVQPGAPLGQGTIFVTAGPGEGGDSLELAPYKAAVAAELRRIGYSESDAGARYIAQVGLDRYVIGADGGRGPVSVGVGGSTGTYGSGLGLGIGINLGGSRERLGTQLTVSIRDASGGTALWEGRADLEVAPGSPLAQAQANAQTLAAALFSDFPGNNGETIQVEVSE